MQHTSNNQTVFDVALMASGTIETAFEVADAYGISVTGKPGIGQAIISLPDTEIVKKVKGEYDARGLCPASDYYSFIPSTGEGIGYWAIEDDFIVGGGTGLGYWLIGTDFEVQ